MSPYRESAKSEEESVVWGRRIERSVAGFIDAYPWKHQGVAVTATVLFLFAYFGLLIAVCSE